MQELKSDLILTKETTKNSFSEIENQEIKDACIKVVEMTLNSIITRIDTELLKMEKEQIIESVVNTVKIGTEKEGVLLFTSEDEILIRNEAEQYYNETFKSE